MILCCTNTIERSEINVHEKGERHAVLSAHKYRACMRLKDGKTFLDHWYACTKQWIPLLVFLTTQSFGDRLLYAQATTLQIRCTAAVPQHEQNHSVIQLDVGSASTCLGVSGPFLCCLSLSSRNFSSVLYGILQSSVTCTKASTFVHLKQLGGFLQGLHI